VRSSCPFLSKIGDGSALETFKMPASNLSCGVLGGLVPNFRPFPAGA